MSEIKVNSIKGVGATDAAITVNNSDGTCTANLSNRQAKNLIINGGMTIAQRGVSSTSTGYQTCDRIQAARGGGAITQAQVDISSSDTPYSLGFRKAFKVTNSTAASAAANYRDIRYYVEAQNVVNSGWNSENSSSNITLSFWARSSVAQTYYFFIYVPDSSKHYVTSFALSANTWTKVTKTIPGATGVTINNDNGSGLNIQIVMWYGGNFSTSGQAVDTWGSWSGSSRVPDMTSTWAATTDATFEVTGLQLEVGSVATDFEHKTFAEELALCQRYCQVFGGVTNYTLFGTGVWKSSTVASIGFPFMTKMRSQPSFSVTSPTNSMVRSGGSNIDVTTVTLDINTTENVMYNANASSGGTNGHGAMHLGKGNTDTVITLTAEL